MKYWALRSQKDFKLISKKLNWNPQQTKQSKGETPTKPLKKKKGCESKGETQLLKKRII